MTCSRQQISEFAPETRKNKTRQPTAAPREAGCKTSAVTRRKRQKTSRCPNATKATAARSADTYKRVAQCETRVPTPLLSTPTPEQHPSKMHRLAVRRLSVNAFPKRPGASPASDGLLSRRWRLGRRVDGVRDGPYRLDAVDAAPPPPREKENKKNTGANFIPLTPLAFIDRARHVFADGPAVVHCVEINQCVGCRR